MERTRITQADRAAMRSLTMACWWPSKINSLSRPDWEGMAGELIALVHGAEDRHAFGTATLAEIHQLRMYRQLAIDQARDYNPAWTPTYN